MQLAFCPAYDPTIKFERLCEKAFSSFLAFRREILKLVKYCERKVGNSAFAGALFSLFFIFQSEAGGFPRQAMMQNHTRESKTKLDPYAI